MFDNAASMIGFITGILFEPLFVWALIVLWILYAKKKKRGLLIGAIICSAIAVISQLVIILIKLLAL